MKNYINPQPHAVDRINKSKNKPLESGKPKKANKTAKEIDRNEKEKRAWNSILQKEKYPNNPK